MLEGFEVRVFAAVYIAVSFPEVYRCAVSAAVEVSVVPWQEMHLNMSQNTLSWKGPVRIIESNSQVNGPYEDVLGEKEEGADEIC